MRQASIAMLERQINARIAKLGQRKQFIVGSLVESKRKCGNKNCRCGKGGELPSIDAFCVFLQKLHLDKLHAVIRKMIGALDRKKFYRS